MNAGRELDALIAERIFGYTLDYEFAEMTGAPCVPALRDQYDEWGVLPEYSTSLAAAEQIINKYWQRDPKQLGWQFIIKTATSGVDVCIRRWEGYTLTGEVWAWGETMPLALCRAALDMFPPS